MTYQELITSIKKKIYSPVYLLMGENTYYIDKVTDYIQNNFFEDESVKDFNFQVLYGKDSTVNQIASLAKQFPMMSDYRVLIVKEAQSLEKIAELASYVQRPQKQTILVLCYKYKTLDKRTVLYKEVDKLGGVFETQKIWDNQVSKFVKEIVAEKDFKIDDYTAELIASHIGTDLSRIDNEITKLKNVLSPGAKITANVVEDYIGISKEYNVFELINAIWLRDGKKAFEIITFFQSNPKNFSNVMVLSQFYTSFMKMLQYYTLDNKENLASLKIPFTAQNAFRRAAQYYTLPQVIKIMSLLKEYDLKSKGYEGSSIQDQELLKELVYKIMSRNFTTCTK
jgi:DNA polymerase III subunit delta